MTPADVIQLLDEPEKLMRRCYLHIAGGATRTDANPHYPPPPANGQAQIATFSVAIGDHQTVRGFTTGLSGLRGRKKDRPFVKIGKLDGVAQIPPPADHFNAYYIPMVQTGDVASNTSHYTLPTGAGALTTMITSKLSGCTFSVGSDGGGAVLVSHVQCNVANKAGSGTLSAFAQTNMATVRGEFRMTYEYDDFAAVIGHRNGTKWRFYMQASGVGNTTDYVISGTQRL